MVLKQIVCQSEGGLLTDSHSNTTYCYKQQKRQQQQTKKPNKNTMLVELHLNNVVIGNYFSATQATTACINKMFCKISGAELCTSCTLLQS